VITTMIFPTRYVQGANAIDVLGEEALRLGKKAAVLCDPFVYANYLDRIQTSLGTDFAAEYIKFEGECSDEEIARLKTLVSDIDVVIGIGGGKTLDTAKAFAYEIGSKVLIVPTLASTDAPCSALSVIYTPEGAFKRYLFLPQNPDTVLVDTTIVVKAPARLLVAGMGDAFATYFEAQSVKASRGKNFAGRAAPMSAHALAELCHETLLEYGAQAKLAAEQQVVTPAFEKIVEANTFLSGIGFESCGLAAAHAIHNGFTVLHEAHNYWHGEKVAFGVLSMLFLTPQKPEVIDTAYNFFAQVGLPTNLAAIGLANVSDEELLQVAQTACAEGETIYNEPCTITPQKVFGAIKVANAEGVRRQKLA